MAFDLTKLDSTFVVRMSDAEWQRILAFRNQPHFDAALESYHVLMSPYFSNNMMLNKVVTEAWRFEMLVYTLYLYDQRDPAIPSSGLTSSNLQRICAKQNCASPGRVLAILGIMRIGGFLHQQKSELDSRVNHLELSKKFIAIVEGWNNRIFQIIDAVVSHSQLAKAHHEQPRFGWNMRKRGAETMFGRWKLLDPFPEVYHFVASDGGWMLLLHCVAEALRGRAGKLIAAVSVDLKTFGKRFGVLRSHLRRLLESAYAERLLDAPPCNCREIKLSAHTVAAFLNCMASELSFYRDHAIAD